jgi:C1A family cysteine protease
MKKYGWLPQPEDKRDFKYKARQRLYALPPAVDLRPNFSPVEDQGNIGSCVGHGVVAAVEFLDRQSELYTDWSRLFAYWIAREIDGFEGEDQGAYIRSGVKALQKVGVCAESVWPYDTHKVLTKPAQTVYNAALPYKATVYEFIDSGNTNLVMDALASGFPVIFGWTVYQSAETSEVETTGDVPLPTYTDSLLGGHCSILSGYDITRGKFKFRNSWGTRWGDSGYGTMPVAFVGNPGWCSDFCVVREVAGLDDGKPTPPPAPPPEPTPTPPIPNPDPQPVPEPTSKCALASVWRKLGLMK